jgi:ABC-type transporter Mla maintaining outer membrane lipid asymmetry permease subunit MlaE
MRATDQLAAMEMMAVDPVRRVVVRDFSVASSPCRC